MDQNLLLNLFSRVSGSANRFLSKHLISDANIRDHLQDSRAYSVTRWKNFLENCFVPQVFYDIGANNPFTAEGQQVVFKPIMPDTRFYLFEAMEKHKKALDSCGEEYAVVLLGQEDGVQKTFYESKAYSPGNGDSYYRERTEYYEQSELITRHLETRSLDSYVRERGWPLPDFMKLDTQGSELDILIGAPECLAATQGLQVECNVQNYNQGAPLLPEVLIFCQTQGFRLYDILQFHFNQDRELLQIDLLFVRENLMDSQD